jgi:hypothetical protein
MCYNVEEWDGLPILRKKRKKRKMAALGFCVIDSVKKHFFVAKTRRINRTVPQCPTDPRSALSNA